MVFGKELILDLSNCKNGFDNKEYLQLFIDELLEKIEMKKVGETIFCHFPETEFNVKNDLVGYTVLQIISLSSLSLHICDISKTIYFNLFTCGELEEEIVISIVNKYFEPTIINKQLLIRNAK